MTHPTDQDAHRQCGANSSNARSDESAETRSNAPSSSNSSDSYWEDEQDYSDYHENPFCPKHPAALYGLVGDVARAGSKNTEANPYAIAVAYMTLLSANIGRDVYLPVGDTTHHCRIFALHVGRSSRARKGDAHSLPTRIEKHIREYSPSLLGLTHKGGLSTREGLARLIQDASDGASREDKRLWVVETEFANVLHQQKRDGNTLSNALRDAWDGVSIQPAIKGSRVWATDPHISVMAAITPTELRELISKRDLSNGFANRFIMIWAERTHLTPFPQPTPDKEVEVLAARTADVIRFARGEYPNSQDSRCMSFSQMAQERYREIYLKELNRCAASDQLTTLLERRAPMLLRLAMLFALTDMTLEISVAHIEAALAWIRYWEESVNHIFHGKSDGLKCTKIAEKIVAYLRENGKARRTELIRCAFQNNITKEELDRALDQLLGETPARIEVIDGEKQANNRKPKFYAFHEGDESDEVEGATPNSAGSYDYELDELDPLKEATVGGIK